MHLNTWTANNKHFVYIIETGVCAESFSLLLAILKAWIISKIKFLMTTNDY